MGFHQKGDFLLDSEQNYHERMEFRYLVYTCHLKRKLVFPEIFVLQVGKLLIRTALLNEIVSLVVCLGFEREKYLSLTVLVESLFEF